MQPPLSWVCDWFKALDAAVRYTLSSVSGVEYRSTACPTGIMSYLCRTLAVSLMLRMIFCDSLDFLRYSLCEMVKPYTTAWNDPYYWAAHARADKLVVDVKEAGDYYCHYSHHDSKRE